MKLTTQYGIVEGTPEEIAVFVKRLIEGAALQPSLPPEIGIYPVYAAIMPRQTQDGCQPKYVAPMPRPLDEGTYVYAAPFPKGKP